MKSKVFISMMLILASGCVVGQTSIALTFTALFEGNHKPLGVIHVKNLTRGGESLLSGGDTVLVLQDQTGIPAQVKVTKGFHLLQNYPNPYNTAGYR